MSIRKYWEGPELQAGFMNITVFALWWTYVKFGFSLVIGVYIFEEVILPRKIAI